MTDFTRSFEIVIDASVHDVFEYCRDPRQIRSFRRASPRYSAGWRCRGLASSSGPGLSVGVPTEYDHVRWKRSVVQQRPRVDTVPDGISHQTPAGLLCMISRGPDHAADMLAWVTVASVDLDSDPFTVNRQGRIELGRVVVSSHGHIAPLLPLWVEAIVLQHPSPHRVVVGVHRGHIDHLPSYPRTANTIRAITVHSAGGS